jgi:prepilin-type N-terminal cleavage/methylation domain-containing protein
MFLMKKFRLNNGFTMVELMTTLGIASVVIIVIINSHKSAMVATGDLHVSSEVNNLIQRMTSELSRAETCTKNFVGKPPTQASISSIKNKSGNANIIATGPYGNEINIDSISTSVDSVTTLSSGSKNTMMNLVVNYTPHSKSQQKFVVPISVFMDNTGNTIKSCFSDLQFYLKQAVMYACKGNGAKWIPASGASDIGSCEHVVELKNEADTVQAPTGGTFLCPTGQFLQKVDASANQFTFKCASVSTTPCGPWEYLESIGADGVSVCKDIRTLFNNSGIMVLQAGTYQTFSIACPTNKILQSITGAGTVNCVNPNLNYTCPANQFATGVDASGNVTCSYSTNSNVCNSGTTYITAIDSSGNVTCSTGALAGGCNSSQVATGLDASGKMICINMP